MKSSALALLAATGLVFSATAAAAENIRVAFIDPLSGAFAATGQAGLHQAMFAAEWLSKERNILDGDTIEIVGFDNQASPKESLIQLQVAIDQGIRFVMQGNSSGVAHAITEAVAKHNRRNPDSRVIYLNYAAVDPALTNEKCNFWHFRIDANADIKMAGLTDVVAANPDIKKVYIIGQDYSFGKAVSAAANRMLAEKRPDIEIVGDELHPIGKVKDFTPYARKIIASEADAVITGNWGADMLGLGKSIIENGFTGPIYTYYGAGDGATAAFGAAGVNAIRLISEGTAYPPVGQEAEAYIRAFKEKYPNNDINQTRIEKALEFLANAIKQTGTSEDSFAIATALEDMSFESMWGGNMTMRKADHQNIQDVSVFVQDNVEGPFDFDNSGYGLRIESTVEAAGADIPTTCEMDRPEE
ncbi:MAG: branched-chain amino acid ABC transporter substrate-binding protein [Pikeienuella sp.]